MNQQLLMACLEGAQTIAITWVGWQLHKLNYIDCTNLPWERYLKSRKIEDLPELEDQVPLSDLLCHTYCAVRTQVLSHAGQEPSNEAAARYESSAGVNGSARPPSSSEFELRPNNNAN